ncbi:MAG: dTDP-4-keto-6-deoxy-D-glucose epimerase [Bacteroidetes bacterium]|nr:MAG: dTDP-4-keto-6-deoxy-D-glucose epimerase [Bacteroidota bacterium]REJ99719.1 MAG: dTDP-4-keto-6-deoxy-D-glucose epimerase [Bacteroidota bacterium]REK32913.1 MAG: dTDP-4-keto-6-deoxy-D-glucose epimerase [Bacteroidota bacterium]REK47718.1 MAG: dTDP-4-keto-6-deoxy-D-glucose epimerase [Bacteroidota bacterium]
MRFSESEIKGLFQIEYIIAEDKRGQFFRTYSSAVFKDAGLIANFIQHNHVINPKKGTWRGLHFQHAPFGEIKLVRCIRGRVMDYVVDLRKDSPTYLRHCSFDLNEDVPNALWIPQGMAHGYITLEDNTEMAYLHSAEYNPSAEDGLRYDDPAIKLTLPCEVAVISDRDMNFNLLSERKKSYPL